ncbi:MAG TPA: nucleotide sugar dehydrogenase [Candidatus Limnocylindria bacterium]
MNAEALRKAIADRSACVGVIGCGYVGLPLAVGFAKAGYGVVAVDVDAERVRKLQAGESYIQDVSSMALAEQVKARRFKATTDYGALRDAHVIFVAVPTPFDRAKQPDLSYIINAAESIATVLQKGQLVVLESTTYPGTTDEVMRPILERSGLRAGTDFYLAFSPERIDPGNKSFGIENTPKVVGGIDPESTALAAAALQQITQGGIHTVSSARVAELTKLLENTFRAVNIALVNELAMLCDRMGIDIWEVIDAAATKPYGFMPFYPGPGVGGHCLGPDEYVYAREGDLAGPRGIADLWRQSAEAGRVENIGDVEAIRDPGFMTLGVGVDGPPQWERATWLFRRPFSGDMITIATADGGRIEVSDRHPMLVVSDAGVVVRPAAEVRVDDLLPLFTENIQGLSHDLSIDLIPYLGTAQRARTRVRIVGDSWAAHAALLRAQFGASLARDWVRGNYLPLDRYLDLETARAAVPSRERLDLWTGRGPATSRLSAVTRLTPDVARLVGYYATEGCISVDGGNPRVRFTFHVEEHQTVADLISILDGLGLRHSIAHDRDCANVQIKVSSALFAAFLRDALRCGVNSYDAAVPATLLAASEGHRMELLTGLMRGDGSVDARSGPRAYRKNGRVYVHQNAAASLSFWTSSPTLERQFLFLLQSLGIRSSIQRRRKQVGADIHLLGTETVRRLAPLFADAKRERLASCLERKQRWPRSRGVTAVAGQPVVRVTGVERRLANTTVYSLESAVTHTFAMGRGIFVHNCIPVDPYYLAWKAREYDFHTKFIELAAETNLAMPFFTVGRIRKQLNDAGRPLRGSRVLVLGASFKKDIDDARESPAIRVMEILHDEGAILEYHDPHVPTVKLASPVFASNGHHETLRSVPLDAERLRKADCVVILVAHTAVDYAAILREAPRVFDAVNATRGQDSRAQVERL